ncbi:hypothetical protein NTGM5_290053 [Candidatus Nitrotoga sp. M5]|nr:hypothetical protein NTGM5_290053 [Candidatus Nitrotoga sp. M5]
MFNFYSYLVWQRGKKASCEAAFCKIELLERPFRISFLSLYVWQAVRMRETQLAFIVMSIFKP